MRVTRSRSADPIGGREAATASRFGFDFGRTAVHAPATSKEGTFGLNPGALEDENVFGRTLGEFVGDIARPIGTALGNVTGGIAGVLTGITISSTDTSAAAWNPDGSFTWGVGFSATGGPGFIVQELNLNWRGNNATGATIPGSPLFPHFFEAWSVDAAGNVSPSVGTTNDIWSVLPVAVQPSPFNTAVEGHWSATSSLHFTTVDPATQGFITNNPKTHSGILLSSTTAPPALNLSGARRHRFAQGTWDTTTTPATHTGSAA